MRGVRSAILEADAFRLRKYGREHFGSAWWGISPRNVFLCLLPRSLRSGIEIDQEGRGESGGRVKGRAQFLGAMWRVDGIALYYK